MTESDRIQRLILSDLIWYFIDRDLVFLIELFLSDV